MRSRTSSRSGFGGVSPEERSGADAFYADLLGWSGRGPSRAESTSPGLGFESFEELFESAFEPEDDAGVESESAEDDPDCPPPGPIPTTCTGIAVPEVIDCFAFDSSAVLARHQPKIVGICRCILASQTSGTPITSLRIVGHADASGDAGPNEDLGRRRAEAVKASIESILSRMTGNRAPRLTITVETRGEREVLPGSPARSRRVQVFPPFPYPLPCPSTFVVTPSSTTIAAGTTAVLRASENQTARPGAITYQWSTSSSKIMLGGATSSPQLTSGPSVTVRAGNQASASGEEIVVTRTQTGCPPRVQRARVFVDCTRFRLRAPRVIAVATDSYITPTTTISDPALLGGYPLRFGQDVSFATGRRQPHGPSQGTTTAALDPIMRRLLGVFAHNDPSGKARRLFNAFLTPRTAVTFWSDADLTAAANGHGNIATFISKSMSSPISPERTSGRTRIHQALQNAGWDINAAVAPTDLGVPALNLGSKALATQDFGNGLGVMINGIQHVIVVAREYRYDACRNEYFIRLEYNFYDVFGLDDDDLREFGADGGIDTNASRGITAWWQLQHQHGYAPIITKITLDRSFTVPAR